MTRNAKALHGLIDAAPVTAQSGLWNLAVAITIPPDLAHALDGLTIIQSALRRIGTRLDSRIAISSEDAAAAHAPSATLIESCRQVLIAINTGNYPHTDPVHHPMVREPGKNRTPLHGFCVDDCPIWVMLFYITDPQLGEQMSRRYQYLFDIILVELLLVTLSRKASDYAARMSAIAEQKNNDSRESRDRSRPSSPYRSPLGGPEWSRIRTAALVLRHLSDPLHQASLEELTADNDAEDLAEVIRRVQGSWIEECKAAEDIAEDSQEAKRKSRYVRILEPLCRLLDYSNPEWRDRKIRIGTGGSGPKSTRQQRTYLGFIRLPESSVLIDRQFVDDSVEVQNLIKPYEWDSTCSGFDSEHLSEFDANPPDDPAKSESYALLLVPKDHPERLPSSGLTGLRIGQHVRKHNALFSTRKNALSAYQIGLVSESLSRPIESAEQRAFQIFSKCALATGRSIADEEFWIVQSMIHLPDDMRPGVVYFSLTERQWTWSLSPPAFSDAKPSQQERALSGRVALPDHLDFHSLADSLFSERSCITTSMKIPWSRVNTSAARACLGGLLGQDSASLQSLPWHVFERLVLVRNGDAALATLLTNRSIGHSRTTLHYSNLTMQEVLNAYEAALAPFRLTHGPSNAAEDTHIGARRVPTRQSISDLICRLRRQFQDSEPSTRWNAFVAYALIGLHLGCAARAVLHRELPHLNKHFPFVRLGEKSVSRYHERVVVPPHCLVQQFEKHADFLQSAALGWTPRDGLFPRFDGNGITCGQLTPSEFLILAQDVGFDFELSSLRRFVRTEMMNRNVSGEDIDAFMGHWNHLCSPFDPLSTYPPRRLFDGVRKVVCEILTDAGYAPMGISA